MAELHVHEKRPGDLPVIAPDIATLVAPLSIQQFLEEHWEQAPLAVAGSEQRLGQLHKLLCGFDVRTILANIDLQRALMHPPKGTRFDPDALSRSLEDLWAHYQLGTQLYLNIDRLVDASAWVNDIGSNLGQIRSEGSVDLYATSRAGTGIGPHFDRNNNFTVQLKGEKHWRVWSPTAQTPLDNAEDFPSVYDPEGLAADDSALGAPLTERTLTPGDVLYVPRGFWHDVQSTRDSLSLNVNITPTPWSSLVLELLRVAFLQNEDLRRNAVYDEGEMAAVLERVRQIASNLHPDRLVANRAPIAPHTQVQRNHFAGWKIRPAESADEFTMTLERILIEGELVLPRAAQPFLRQLATLSAPTTVSQLAKQSGLSQSDAVDLTNALRDAGLIVVDA